MQDKEINRTLFNISLLMYAIKKSKALSEEKFNELCESEKNFTNKIKEFQDVLHREEILQMNNHIYKEGNK